MREGRGDVSANGTGRGVPKALGQGIKDLPRNASWLLSKALRPIEAGTDATKGAGAHGLVDRSRQARVALREALPGNGDSIELRLARARAAADQARSAEEQALHDAEEAKAAALRAREVADGAKARLREAEKEQAKEVDRQVTEAQRE